MISVVKKINHGEGIEYSGKVGGRTAWELVIREGLPEVVTFQLDQEWDSESESKEQFKKEKTSGNEWHINGEKKMNGEEKMNLWSFHSRREPHIHPQRRHPRFLSANPTGLAMHLGKLAFPPPRLAQWNPVWFSNWHSNWLFFAEICEIRHWVNWHYEEERGTAQNILCKRFLRHRFPAGSNGGHLQTASLSSPPSTNPH